MLTFLEANGGGVAISDVEIEAMTIELQRRAEADENAAVLVGWIASRLADCRQRSRCSPREGP